MKLISLLASIVPLATAFAPTHPACTSSRVSTELYADASIQFAKGLDEKVVPDIKLTRARGGSSGTATFRFQNLNVFDASTAKDRLIQSALLLGCQRSCTQMRRFSL
jgi:hypothetical protein